MNCYCNRKKNGHIWNYECPKIPVEAPKIWKCLMCDLETSDSKVMMRHEHDEPFATIKVVSDE